MKIAIIGCPGSGKSTLAFKLQKILKLPLYHLDQYFWQPGWQRPDRAEFAKVHHALCDKDEWVIKGMATRLFEYRAARADVIIFLDVPLYTCLYRVFKRSFIHFGKEHASSPKGCPDWGPSLEFLKYILNFNRTYKPGIEALLKKYRNEKKIFVVKSNAECDELVKKFAKG